MLRNIFLFIVLVEIGILKVLNGTEAGNYKVYSDGALGVGYEGFSVSYETTRLYHNGPRSQIKAKDFLGHRLAFNAGGGFLGNFGVNITFGPVYRPRPSWSNGVDMWKYTVYGLGIGYGFGLPGITGSINYGKTQEIIR